MPCNDWTSFYFNAIIYLVMSNAVLNLKHCTKIKYFVHKLHHIFSMINSYCFLNYLFNLGSLFYWPLLFYDFQEVSAVIICCSHSCFKKIQFQRNLLQKKKKNVIYFAQCSN